MSILYKINITETIKFMYYFQILYQLLSGSVNIKLYQENHAKIFPIW